MKISLKILEFYTKLSIDQLCISKAGLLQEQSMAGGVQTWIVCSFKLRCRLEGTASRTS